MTSLRKRIGVDVTGLYFSKNLTGIERVIIETINQLDEHLDSNLFEIRPFVTLPEKAIPSPLNFNLSNPHFLIEPFAPLNTFDILFFGSINLSVPVQDLIRLKSENGVKIVTLIHDILPITHPEWFEAPKLAGGQSITLSSKNAFQIYLQSSFALSDHIVVTSKHVLSEIAKYNWRSIPQITIIPLGAFDVSKSNKKIEHKGINTIYVSTVAVRKGHPELLSAFDLLWEKNFDISLTIVGAKGWLVENFLQRLLNHPQYGLKLFWEKELSDTEVINLYQRSDIAFITSEDEGYGLVLDEGIANNLKVIARDIPVFRERNYPNLYFYSGGPKGLSDKISEVVHLPLEEIPANSIRSMKDFTIGVAKLLEAL